MAHHCGSLWFSAAEPVPFLWGAEPGLDMQCATFSVIYRLNKECSCGSVGDRAELKRTLHKPSCSCNNRLRPSDAS